jgi:hypothetical protein
MLLSIESKITATFFLSEGSVIENRQVGSRVIEWFDTQANPFYNKNQGLLS